MTRLSVVVGAQFGSEAKGHVTAQLLHRSPPLARKMVTRVAGPNAGHSVVDPSGRKHAYRQLPVGVALDMDNLAYGIAAGSEIEGTVLLAEIDQAMADFKWFDPGNLYVDPQATILLDDHKQDEAKDKLTERTGSTGKGIGAARADRIMRGATILDQDTWLVRELQVRGVKVRDTAAVMETKQHVVIEGTQGYGLGLHAGYYPFCTSSDCRAIDFLAMAGVNPWSNLWDNFEVWAVARVFPIRVAGNSGPLRAETTWEDLGLPEEYTTVTKKVRRVGEWDASLVARAVAANGDDPVVRLAITMLDQKYPDLEGVTDAAEVREVAGTWIKQVEQEAMANVAMVTTSASTAAWLR